MSIVPVMDVSSHSSHEFSVLAAGFKDTPEANLSSNQSALLDSLLNSRPRKLSHMEDMLGQVVYAARERGTNLPDRGVHPGRLAAIAANGEGHVRVDLPCANSTAHPHSEICHQYIDQELVRHAGTLQEDLSGSVIFKGEDQIHRSIEFLAATRRGLTLIPLPGEPGNELFAWFFPPEPVDDIEGKRVFRDRTVDSTDRVRRLHYARKRAGPNRARNFDPTNPDDPYGLSWNGRRTQRGAVQGFLLSQKWSYTDIGGQTMEVPAVHHSPSNPDTDLINRWLDSRQTRG